jgi:hypothetical protein
MPVPDEPISLGLNTPAPDGAAPPVERLQFRRAEPIATYAASSAPPVEGLQFGRAEPTVVSPVSSAQRCVACQGPIAESYYHASGRVVCPACAARIQQGQQQPPAYSFPRALLFGGAAALAGCAIYAIVAIATGMEIGLIAILVGVMVGKAIRRASGGFGGRQQQILAVILTYFSIATSYIPVIIWEVAHKSKIETSQTATSGGAAQTSNGGASQVQPDSGRSRDAGKAILYLLAIGAVAPFLALTSGVSGIISLSGDGSVPNCGWIGLNVGGLFPNRGGMP